MNFEKLERILDKRMSKFIRRQISEREKVRLDEIRDFTFNNEYGPITLRPGYYESKCNRQLQDLTKLVKKHEAMKSSFILLTRNPKAKFQISMKYSNLDKMLNRKMGILINEQMEKREKADNVLNKSGTGNPGFLLDRYYSSREELELEHISQIDKLHEQQQRVRAKFIHLQKQHEQNCKDRDC